MLRFYNIMKMKVTITSWWGLGRNNPETSNIDCDRIIIESVQFLIKDLKSEFFY